MTSAGIPYWRSLRFRLPALVSAVIAIVFAGFLWALNGALEATLAGSGSERAQRAASQVSDMVGQSAGRSESDLRRLAGQGPVIRFLAEPADDREIRRLLAPLAVNGQPPVEVWSADGRLLLEIAPARPSSADPALVRAGPAALQPGVSPFRMIGDAVAYNVVADVRAPSAGKSLLGHVVLRRLITTSQNSSALTRLVGDQARVRVGNQGGDLWTDLSARVRGPAVDASRSGTATYRSAEGVEILGAVSTVAGTPWAAWVGFPRDTVVAPARVLLFRMIALGAGALVIAGVLVSVVSRRITQPLSELTMAAAAVSGGDFSRRVGSSRRDEIGRLGAAFNAMADEIGQAQRTLETRVEERTLGLQQVNQELEAFSYSVSHDLRAPLRHISGFAALLSKSAANLGDADRRYLATIVAAAGRMGQLIDDLLAFSRVGRTAIHNARVDLNQLAADAQSEVSAAMSTPIDWQIEPLPTVHGDRALLRLVFVNLLSNAAKYSATQPSPRVTVGAEVNGREAVVFVRDNGVGFDMAFADKLFGVFQRLHRSEEFEGTGIGLANVRRIVQRHGGRTWAEGAVNQGATFSFSLPLEAHDAG